MASPEKGSKEYALLLQRYIDNQQAIIKATGKPSSELYERVKPQIEEAKRIAPPRNPKRETN